MHISQHCIGTARCLAGAQPHERTMKAGRGRKDYKAELIEMFNNMDIYFTTKHKRYVASRYRNFFISVAAIATDKDYKAIYEGLISGDPKLRSYRALYQRIYGRYITEAKREEAKKNG